MHGANGGEDLVLLEEQQPYVRARQEFLVRTLGRGNSLALRMVARDVCRPRRGGLSINREP